MYRESDRQLSTASQSIIVDKLLSELPHVPVSRPPAVRRHTKTVLTPAPRPVASPFVRRRQLTQVGRARTADETAGGVWARVALGITLGVAMTFWPYQMCSGGLAGYLGGVVTIMSAAVWSATVAWQRRAAFAHVISIGLFVWGIALASDQLLQRTGYAYAQVGWMCN